MPMYSGNDKTKVKQEKGTSGKQLVKTVTVSAMDLACSGQLLIIPVNICFPQCAMSTTPLHEAAATGIFIDKKRLLYTCM